MQCSLIMWSAKLISSRDLEKKTLESESYLISSKGKQNQIIEHDSKKKCGLLYSVEITVNKRPLTGLKYLWLYDV